MSDPAPLAAFMFRVHLGVLATNLTDQYGTRQEAANAHQWLIRAMKTKAVRENGVMRTLEPSPFRATDEMGIYYSDEDPREWLEPEEIGWVREVPRTRDLIPHFHPGGE